MSEALQFLVTVSPCEKWLTKQAGKKEPVEASMLRASRLINNALCDAVRTTECVESTSVVVNQIVTLEQGDVPPGDLRPDPKPDPKIDPKPPGEKV